MKESSKEFTLSQIFNRLFTLESEEPDCNLDQIQVRREIMHCKQVIAKTIYNELLGEREINNLARYYLSNSKNPNNGLELS